MDMRTRWLLVGLAFSAIAAACAPSVGTTAPSTSMGQTLEPPDDTVPTEPDPPIGGPVLPGAPEKLPSGDLAPPESTLFEITTASEETGPPFYVRAAGVIAAGDDAWATQQLTIVSEWRTPIAVLPPPTRYVLDSRQVSRPPPSETALGQPTIIRPGASMSVLLVLEPRLSTGPAPGIYEVAVPITYWRDVDAAAGPTGSPEDTLILNITYQVLDARMASPIRAFCDQALVAAADLAEFDQERLDRGLEAMETAAEQLPPSKREELLAETAQLRLQLEQWFSPTPGHGGFSTDGVISFVNRLCGTDLPSMSVQA